MTRDDKDSLVAMLANIPIARTGSLLSAIAKLLRTIDISESSIMIPTLLKDKCEFDAYEMLTLAKILKASILGHNDLVEFYLSESSSQHQLSIINGSPIITRANRTSNSNNNGNDAKGTTKSSSLTLETHNQIQQQRSLQLQHLSSPAVLSSKQISPYNNHHHHHHHHQHQHHHNHQSLINSRNSFGSSNGCQTITSINNNQYSYSNNNNNNNSSSSNNNNNNNSNNSSNSLLALQQQQSSSSTANSLKSSTTNSSHGQSSSSASAASSSRSTPMPHLQSSPAETIESSIGSSLEIHSSSNGDPDATVRLLLQIEQLKVFIPQVTNLFESIIELYKNSVDTITQK